MPNQSDHKTSDKSVDNNVIEKLTARINKLESKLNEFMKDTEASRYPKIGQYMNGYYWHKCGKCNTYDMIPESCRNMGV